MSKPARSRVRVLIRRLRLAVLVTLLGLLLALVYLGRVGLPDFLKRPLLDRLRAQGVEIEFTRLRLRFDRGIVAENVRFGRATEPGGPRLSAKEVEVKLNYLTLARLHVQVDALGLHSGRLEWPVPDTNRPPRTLLVERLQADLHFLPGDRWTVDNFEAGFAGARFILTGTVTNASAIQSWDVLHGRSPAGTGARRLRRLADTLEQIHFATPPELRLAVNGNARDLRSFACRLTLTAPDAATPWGQVARGVVVADLFPATNGAPSQAELNFQAADVQTPWASADSPSLVLQLVALAGFTNLADGYLTLRAARVESRWASATNAQFKAHWVHALTNAIPLSGSGDLQAAAVRSRWADGTAVQVTASLAPARNAPPADASWGGWRLLQPYDLDWACRVGQLRCENLGVDQARCAGQWRAPSLTATNLHADFQDGSLDAHGELNVASRAARFGLVSDFDVQKIAPWLTDKSRRWLSKFSWANPPRLAGSGAMVLPAWTNWGTPGSEGSWRAEVQPSIRLDAEFAVTNGAYLGVPADWARSHVTYSNRVWRLPDLEVGRPEGRLFLAHQADERTKDYYWRLRGNMDPHALRPVLPLPAQRGLDYFTSTSPPFVEGEVWGRFYEYDSLGFAGRVALTNFTFRGQRADQFESAVRYTNRVVEFLEPWLMRSTQALHAAAVVVDIPAQRVYFTNGLSTAEPLAVARAIGPKTGRALEPYRFPEPPTVRVNGFAPFESKAKADLRFDVNGGPFEWWKFRVPRISGRLHWLDRALVLTNMQAAFYGGTGAGSAFFDFRREPGADFTFDVVVTNANLLRFMADVSPRTNHLEGLLSGRLVITNANSIDAQSWNGHGRVQLRDGLIWEIPVFGVLSKPLDAVVPGLGSTRASEGSTRFIITNGVIFADALELRAPALRLQYSGTVDFQGRVDARVVAEPLRDAWVVGPLLNLAFWPVSKLFEYRISGTLSDPKSEPLYIPKLFLFPLHPLRTLEELFPAESSLTNAPPQP